MTQTLNSTSLKFILATHAGFRPVGWHGFVFLFLAADDWPAPHLSLSDRQRQARQFTCDP